MDAVIVLVDFLHLFFVGFIYYLPLLPLGSGDEGIVTWTIIKVFFAIKLNMMLLFFPRIFVCRLIQLVTIRHGFIRQGVEEGKESLQFIFP